jgi:flagellar L-ring protein precursor FlgH
MSNSAIPPVVAPAIAALLAACATTNAAPPAANSPAAAIAHDAKATAKAVADATRRAAGPPQFTPMGLSAAPPIVGIPTPQTQAFTPTANSLWRPNGRGVFRDQRASNVGDILTVKISIADSADLSNESSRARKGATKVGVTSIAGFETNFGRVMPGGFDPINIVDASGDSTASGKGSVARQEKVELTVAAMVIEVLPNGALLVSGRQEVRVNAEMRELAVAGIIRPQDITPENTILHTQMAEARISYGGRGQISAVQRPRIGQRIADAVSPW